MTQLPLSTALGRGWKKGNPEAVAALLTAMSAEVRAAMQRTADDAHSSLWLLFLADSHRAAMLDNLRAAELDESHFEDFTSELSALLTGALHVPDATDAAGECVRAALARIPELRKALAMARAEQQN